MSPEQYCQDKAAKSGSSFYYSFIFLPEQQRQAITALYAFCREVDDIVDSDMDTTLKKTKLHWWKNEIDALYKHAPQHPVTRALQTALRHYDLPQEQFHEIIDGMLMDTEQVQYESFKSLALYCYRVAAVVGLLAAEIFGYQDRRTLKYAHDLGIAFQLTNILRDIGEDARHGRVYLPQDELSQFGVSNRDILQGKTSEQFIQLMQFQAQRARQYYESAYAHLPEADRYSQRAGIIMSAIYQNTLQEITNDGFRVLQHRIKLTPLRKFWLAWKTMRREKHRHKQWLRQHPQHS